MNIFLWILQALLGAAFLLSGIGKLTQPKEKLQARTGMAYVEDFSTNAIKGIGAAEALGGLGVILPWATGIARVLTPLAAVGLVLVMVGAIVTHVRRKETTQIAVPATLLLLAVVVAIGRFVDM